MDQITLNKNANAWLILDESLQILQDCLQADTNICQNSAITKNHIQRLKYFYSPWFDFEYSESGSYFYATLKCTHAYYLNLPSEKQANISPNFSESLDRLLDISLYALSPTLNQRMMIEHMVKLASIWEYQHCDDMQTLLLFVFNKMRKSILNIQEPSDS